jgi:hypothetical protein
VVTFYQQKIEWVWLLFQHPDLFAKAMTYEKDGYKWMDSEMLVELMQPARVVAIKEEYLKRIGRADVSSAKLLDFLLEDEDLGCVSCFCEWAESATSDRLTLRALPNKQFSGLVAMIVGAGFIAAW